MKYVLITGAFGGMGKRTCELFSKNGFTVFALDKNIPDDINRNERILPIKADVTEICDVENAMRTVKNTTDTLFAVIHFAGIYMLDSLVEMSQNDYERIFKINVFGAFNVNKVFRPMLKGGSRILIITSELAPLNPLPFTGVYAISKGALDKYAFSLRMELQLADIYVSVLRAGAVDTGMIDASTVALDRFCENTELYTCNGKRFKKIVDSVEARKITPEKLAAKSYKIVTRKKPSFAYTINRNPLLLLLNLLPKNLQFRIIKKVLK